MVCKLLRHRMTDKPDRVHDAFFTEIFEDTARAAAELCAILPPEIVDLFHWDTLQLQPSTFKGGADRNRACDLLFSVHRRDVQDAALVHVLFEHQSTDDRLMPLRMLRYMLRIWDRWRKDHPGAPLPLPPILPVVLCHDAAGWRSARAFHELFAADPGTQDLLRRFTPEFELVVDDLARIPDAALASRPLPPAVALALWVLRDARSPPVLLEHLPTWAARLAELESQPGGLDALTMILRYVGTAAGEASVSIRVFVARAVESVPQTKQVIMNSLEKLLEEGRQEGRQEGLLEGKRLVLLEQLQLRFGDLTPRELQRLGQADADALARYALRVLTADSVVAVLGD